MALAPQSGLVASSMQSGMQSTEAHFSHVVSRLQTCVHRPKIVGSMAAGMGSGTLSPGHGGPVIKAGVVVEEVGAVAVASSLGVALESSEPCKIRPPQLIVKITGATPTTVNEPNKIFRMAAV
jgi:hypothetical protein